MPVSVTMPRLGESVAEGTVTRWLKSEGDHVEADEPLLEISTDKVDTEIPSPASGVLSRISVAEDETVEVGSELAVIEESGEAAGGAATEPAEAPPAEAPAGTSAETSADEPAPVSSAPEAEQEGPQPAPAPEPPAPAARPAAEAAPVSAPDGDAAPETLAEPTPLPTASEAAYVTPLVRKLATEHGVDLTTIDGTGVGGRIRKQDVLEAARAQPAAAQPSPEPAPRASREEPAAPAPPPASADLRGRTEKMSRPRQIIAARMHESLQVSAQLTTVVEADVTEIARLRDRAKGDFQAREGVKLTFLPFFALATVEALKIHPVLNATLDMEKKEISYYDSEHLGIAVDTDKGLIVPVIRDAGDLNIAGLARKIADVADRVRAGRALPDELSGGTFTITNTGSRGALIDTPIINQPQVGILGTGGVVKRPVVVDDPDLGEVIAVRSMIYLSLTYDHRLVDGADAARFLVTLKTRLEEGGFEAELGLT